ncbi:MAG: putative sulfate exporter family transporter, partial [Neomegalonema sp.]
PNLLSTLEYTDQQIGIMIGATIHDVAKVVCAENSVSQEVGATDTLVKLIRVALLPVVLLIIIGVLRSRATGSAPGLPWFVVGFCILSAINSLDLLPTAVMTQLSDVSRVLLVTAIAALGVKTSMKAVFELGPTHLSVVVMETVVLLLLAILATSLWLG